MPFRNILMIGFVALVVVIGIVALISTQLTPQATSPAFTAAVDFVNAAEAGDDSAALALLNEPMRAYVAAHCAEGKPSACLDAYIPPEWGELVTAVFRRAAPDGANWNVEVIAHYASGVGASGVCSLIRVEPEGEAWRVAGWAGFIHCGTPESRDMATNPNTPNRAP